jgi:hypothetical protein
MSRKTTILLVVAGAAVLGWYFFLRPKTATTASGIKKQTGATSPAYRPAGSPASNVFDLGIAGLGAATKLFGSTADADTSSEP